MPREQDKDRIENLLAKVDVYNLVENLESCLQCGKCAGVCPVANISPSYNPRQIINDMLSGRLERWLKSEEIWRCFWCANCYTMCPVDIPFPMLMMQIRYYAIERGYGLKYFLPFKRFAVKAREEGLTFVPTSAKNRARIRKIREGIGLVPWPDVSEKAREDYKALFDMTGATAFLEGIKGENEKPVHLTYMEGRITSATRKDD